MRILNVDDSEENLYFVESLLKGNGFEVVSVMNGAEALVQLESVAFDLIISDILMPVMDGFQLCRKVKMNEELRHIPFIVYTATYTGPQDEAFAFKIGADKFIQKPCEPDIFMETVREALGAAANADPVAQSAPQTPEEEVLKLYNERLVRKLEQKMLQLEEEVEVRKKVEEELRKSENHLRSLIRTIPDLIWLKDKDGMYLSCNPVFERFFGENEANIVGKSDYSFVDRELADFFRENDYKAIAAGKPISNEEWITFADDGHRALLETIKTPMYDERGTLIGVLGIGRDITERKKAEEERANLQQQLIQAQKMESIGRLAGGVAHDFNNMLSVIIGFSEIALNNLDPTDALYEDLREIYAAGVRSASITRQLLAFARKQIINPAEIDLNNAVESLLKMLHRLIGEDIDLVWLPKNCPLPVAMDPSQLDQLLVNLCINARDAIDGVGKMTIETDTITLDTEYCNDHPGFTPGDYVLLAVSDEGCGMDRETVTKIFEPFFTTKEVGQGTGLGLATVYGIVKQNNGVINVYSELGQGTTFRIYLPRYHKVTTATMKEKEEGFQHGRGETILVVEDEVSILKLASRMLTNLGYIVITADSPKMAIKLAKETGRTLDLLVTDVIMPEMNGRDLANELLTQYPNLKCLFMSGYTSTVIVGKGVLEEGMHFIQKPFSARDLGAKVHEALKKGPENVE